MYRCALAVVMRCSILYSANVVSLLSRSNSNSNLNSNLITLCVVCSISIIWQHEQELNSIWKWAKKRASTHRPILSTVRRFLSHKIPMWPSNKIRRLNFGVENWTIEYIIRMAYIKFKSCDLCYYAFNTDSNDKYSKNYPDFKCEKNILRWHHSHKLLSLPIGEETFSVA